MCAFMLPMSNEVIPGSPIALPVLPLLHDRGVVQSESVQPNVEHGCWMLAELHCLGLRRLH